MAYKNGDRVIHPSLEEWGLGEVLEDSAGNKVRIFFVGTGEKTLSLDYVEPIMVQGDDAAHPLLDDLKPINTSKGLKYQSLPHSIEIFLNLFPKGFYEEEYMNKEREYKIKAHNLALELLTEEGLKTLLDRGEYEEICSRALKVVNATNLIFPNEKMALKDGLASQGSQRLFVESLFGLLYGKDEFRNRFESFSNMLEEINAAKWTTATYFPFLVEKGKNMFVKPTVTQHAAEVCAYQINYRSELNWLTYSRVLEFAEYLKKGISALNPRDMIDVQSFMWCITPGKY